MLQFAPERLIQGVIRLGVGQEQSCWQILEPDMNESVPLSAILLVIRSMSPGFGFIGHATGEGRGSPVSLWPLQAVRSRSLR